jgi:tetratricopeptide (TPR) repeat protein
VVGVLLLADPAAPAANRAADVALATLSHTVHPPVARDAAQLWMAPSAADRTTAAANPALVHLQAALRLYADEKYEQALNRFSAAATPKSPLRAHAVYYAGVSELRLRRFEAARQRFAELKKTPGFVGEAAALGEAEPPTLPAAMPRRSTPKLLASAVDARHLAEHANARSPMAIAARGRAFLVSTTNFRQRARGRQSPRCNPSEITIDRGTPLQARMGRGERLFGSADIRRRQLPPPQATRGR